MFFEVSSNHRLHVRSHQRVDAVGTSRREQRIDPAAVFPQIIAKRGERDIEADMTPITEAVCDGLGRRGEADRYAFDRPAFDPMFARRPARRSAGLPRLHDARGDRDGARSPLRGITNRRRRSGGSTDGGGRSPRVSRRRRPPSREKATTESGDQHSEAQPARVEMTTNVRLII
jgi:hypothetical protein